MPSGFNVGLSERIVSAISYITAGWGGIICWIIFYFAHIKMTKFMRFNIFQSIFISFAYFVIYSIMCLLFILLSHIPFIQIISGWIQLLLFKPFIFDYSLLQVCVVAFVAYCVLCSFFGRYPRIYKVSEWINSMAR